MSRVTLKIIAKEAKVSVATVSMALRGQGKLLPKTTERVRAIAERLGYTPDPLLASLASRRFRSGEQAEGLHLALLEFPPFKDGVSVASQYRTDLIAEARKLGYAPYTYSSQELSRYHDFTRLLYHRGTVAAIVTGQAPRELFQSRERWNKFAVVQCGRYQKSPAVHTVRPNTFQAVQLAFEKAHERGYKRIGFALGRHPDLLEDDLARLGAAQAMVGQLLPRSEQVPPYFGSLEDYESILRWGKSKRVDCYVGFSVGLWYHLNDHGIRCPEDAGFIALHRKDDNPGHPNAFSGLDQMTGEIARQAVLLIDRMVRHNERGLSEAPLQILVQSKWVEGETLRKCESKP